MVFQKLENNEVSSGGRILAFRKQGKLAFIDIGDITGRIQLFIRKNDLENFVIEAAEDFEAFESEDTLSILNRYIQEAEIQLDKSRVQNIMRKTYQEACELI